MTRTRSLRIAQIAVTLFIAGSAAAAEPADLPVVASDDFESGRIAGWIATDPQAWRIAVDGDKHFLQQFAASQVQTQVRSPFNRALLSGVTVGNFQLDVDV
ncbi:MAG TPA: hypothetical protein VM510_08425, partial [Caulifigura sp.]|nr:hypothetical protein [Caulifigura sp.]